MAQSQVIKGTIVPVKKKAVIILPVNKKDSSVVAQKKDTSIVVKKKDSIVFTQKKVPPVLVKKKDSADVVQKKDTSVPKSKPFVNGTPVLQGLDTTVKNSGKNKIINNDFTAQMIKGTNISKKNKPLLFVPVSKKDSIEAAKKKAAFVPKLKPAVKVKPVLQGLDTTIETNNQNKQPVKTNLKAQYLQGVISAKEGNVVVFKPIPEDSLKKIVVQQQPVDNGIKVKNPLDVLDTTLIAVGSTDVVSKYSLPPEHSQLRAQLITGALIAKPGAPVNIVPSAEEAVPSNNQERMDFPLYPPERNVSTDSVAATRTDTIRSVMDGLDTTKMVYDPAMSISSAPYPPSTYKSQIITSGTFIPNKGAPVKVEPIRVIPDSLKDDETNTDTQSNNQYTDNDVKNDSEDSADSKAGKVGATFFVNQFGKFTVHFVTNKFYFNLSQSGRVIDFGILSNGKITSDNNNRIIQVGNIKVNYNTDGTIGSIGGVNIGYTYDDRVNRIGEVNINYSINGAMEKVADMPILYNVDDAVQKIAAYRVGYDSRQMVIGIDDSNGLVVFKPVVK
ncbi:hypothetical protein GALL_228610 [mine drainage metagenome]|uniref:Uncharacterized protein n=1 Tax=mine drainage metagenome TaxID=410659 RepID=A0A1J5S080_9ZZZZ